MTREDQDKRQSNLAQHSTHFFLLDQRFRKPFSRPYSSLLRLIQAKSSQGLGEKRTLAGVGWNELE